jgi:hypothetical protein
MNSQTNLRLGINQAVVAVMLTVLAVIGTGSMASADSFRPAPSEEGTTVVDSGIITPAEPLLEKSISDISTSSAQVTINSPVVTASPISYGTFVPGVADWQVVALILLLLALVVRIGFIVRAVREEV